MSEPSGGRPVAKEKIYWRSLERLRDDPQVREHYEREFLPSASELPEGISRRSMVQLLGASLSMAGLAGCRRPVEHIVPYVEPPEQVVPGLARYYATTMPFGTAAYGLVVESNEGRPTKIEGNELHPSSAGATSVLAQASILDLYDPDRSRSVLEGEEERSWEDFAAAWAKLEGSLAADGGAGLAVLTGAFASPTLHRLAAAFRERYPNARWVVWEPVSDEAIQRGLEAATGAAVQPLYAFDRARVILSIDSDFLAGESESVRHARGFAEGRRVRGERSSMSRLYAVEGVHSITGANADHRFRLASGHLGGFVVRLAAELASQGLEIEVPAGASSLEIAGVESEWLGVLASDLLAHRGAAAVVAGRRQPWQVHAAVAALNAALGNVGSTVHYHELGDAAPVRSEGFVELVAAMRGGEVTTLVALGSNPVYAAPADLDFAAALGDVETVIHLGSHRDETAQAAHWHVPETHFLEAWGDARATDGTLSVVQPLIAPLFAARSKVEVLGLLASGMAQAGHDLVRETWRSRLDGAADFDATWNRVLHDGLLAASAGESVAATVDGDHMAALLAVARSDAPGTQDLEIVFQASPAVFDGRFANNGWLQELPDAMTKVTWDNAALLSPETAQALGVEKEDLVRLRYGGGELELPAWIVPGQADNSVVVSLGYGRSAGGRVAAGVGANAYLLRTSEAPDIGRGASVERIDRRYDIAQTQDHHGMEGRAIVVEGTLDEYHHEPEFAREAGPEKPHEHSMWNEWVYDKGYQWGMTIDLNACVGCNACVVACQSENNVSIVGKEQVRNGREMHWLRVDRYFSGDAGSPATVFQPVPCMQCENAPCEQVCPVAATVHDDEGLNVMVYNRCIGTRYCSNNCPYKVRRFNFFNYTKDTPEVVKLVNNPDVSVRSRGVMEKCTYCTQRINRAKIDARLEDRTVRDGEIRTACQQACPAQAIEFGNLLDPQSRVVASKTEPRNYILLDELHVKPRTTFLAKLRNPHPELS